MPTRPVGSICSGGASPNSGGRFASNSLRNFSSCWRLALFLLLPVVLVSLPPVLYLTLGDQGISWPVRAGDPVLFVFFSSYSSLSLSLISQERVLWEVLPPLHCLPPLSRILKGCSLLPDHQAVSYASSTLGCRSRSSAVSYTTSCSLGGAPLLHCSVR